MARYVTDLTNLPYGEPTMTKWYQLYRESLFLTDLSLFSRREDGGIFVIGGGNIAYNIMTNILSWDANIQLIHPFSKEVSEIGIGSKTVPLDSYVYMNLKRLRNNNGGMIPLNEVNVSAKLPNNDIFYVLFYVTSTGAVVTNVDTSIATTPIAPISYILFDDIETGVFPHNAVSSNVVGNSSIIVSDSGNNNKSIFLEINTPHDLVSGVFNLNFDFEVSGNSRDLYYNLDVYKNTLLGSPVSSNVFSVSDIHFTPSVANSIIRFADTNIFTINPNEYYTIQIDFLNSNAGLHLGAVEDINIYSFFLTSN